MTRREILAMAGSAPAWLSPATMSAQTPSFPRMGGAPTAFAVRSSGGRTGGRGAGAPGARGAGAPAGGPPAGGAPGGRAAGGGRGASNFDILEHCHSIGLYGVQMNPPTDPEALKTFRKKLESYEMTDRKSVV
jgi:hypothetical protein